MLEAQTCQLQAMCVAATRVGMLKKVGQALSLDRWWALNAREGCLQVSLEATLQVYNQEWRFRKILPDDGDFSFLFSK